VDEGNLTLWGLLLLGACIAFVWSRGYRLRRTWKKSVDALDLGDMATAEKYLQSCVNQAPSWVPARRLLGRTLVALQRYDEAENHLRLVSKFEPRNAEGHFELAVFLANCPPVRPEDAIDSLSSAIEYGPRLRAGLEVRPEFAALRDHPRFRELAEGSTINSPSEDELGE